MKRYYLLILLIYSLTPFYAQETESNEIRNSYHEIVLGMSFDEVKEKLIVDSSFDYEGDIDHIIISEREYEIIDCEGRGHIKRAWFQFREDSLVVIALVMDPEKVDYFSIYKTLSDSYGDPVEMSPEIARWGSEKYQISLELPVTVKYLDKEYFDILIEESRSYESWQERSLEEFLEDF